MLHVAKQQLGTNKFTHAVYLFIYFLFGSRPTKINALFIVMRKSSIASRVRVKAISARRTPSHATFQQYTETILLE